MERIVAPRSPAMATARFVSVVVPDWVTAMTSVSERSSQMKKPLISEAFFPWMLTGAPARYMPRPSAMAWPATAAVPWPMTKTRRIFFALRLFTKVSGRMSRPRLKRTFFVPSFFSSMRYLPRRVLRTDWADSVISLRKKWGKAPRSMSRVVISACWIMDSVSPTGCPS